MRTLPEYLRRVFQGCRDTRRARLDTLCDFKNFSLLIVSRLPSFSDNSKLYSASSHPDAYLRGSEKPKANADPVIFWGKAGTYIPTYNKLSVRDLFTEEGAYA
jgi:hypothetical protein